MTGTPEKDKQEGGGFLDNLSLGIAIGMGIGLAVGAAMGNIALGVAFGPAFGIILAVVLGSRSANKQSGCADGGAPKEENSQ